MRLCLARDALPCLCALSRALVLSVSPRAAPAAVREVAGMMICRPSLQRPSLWPNRRAQRQPSLVLVSLPLVPHHAPRRILRRSCLSGGSLGARTQARGGAVCGLLLDGGVGARAMQSVGEKPPGGCRERGERGEGEGTSDECWEQTAAGVGDQNAAQKEKAREKTAGGGGCALWAHDGAAVCCAALLAGGRE